MKGEHMTTFGWLTAVGEEGGCTATNAVFPGGVGVPLPLGEAKLSVFKCDAATRRVKPDATVFFTVAGSPDDSAPTTITVGGYVLECKNHSLRDFTAEVVDALASHVKECRRAWYAGLKILKFSLQSPVSLYLHMSMQEAELPAGVVASCCYSGWPQLHALSRLPEDEVRAAFGAAVGVVKHVTCFDAGVASGMDGVGAARVRQTLFACALRVYAGVYPAGKEDVDDRSLGCLKLCTNSDCDDMAITSGAFFNRLFALRETLATPTGRDGFSSGAILAEGLHAFVGVVCCQGTVSPATAVPRSLRGLWQVSKKGHVWCMLERRGGGFAHLECTRCVDCHVDGVGIAECFKPHPTNEEREQGLAVCDVDRYHMVSAVYSATGMRVPVESGSSVVGALYAHILSGDAKLVDVATAGGVPAVPAMVEKMDALRHAPTHDMLSKISASTRVLCGCGLVSAFPFVPSALLTYGGPAVGQQDVVAVNACSRWATGAGQLK